MIWAILNETAASCEGNGIWYNIYEKMIAWSIVIIISLVCCYLFLQKAAKVKADAISQSKVYRGYGWFILGYGLSRIVFIFSDIERWNNCITDLQVQFVLTAYTIGFFSALSLISIVEGELLNFRKRILTKIYFAFAVLSGLFAIFVRLIIEYLAMIRAINMATNIFGSLLLIIIFGKLIIQSTGVVRRRSLLTLAAVALILIGSIIDSELFIRSLSIPIWFPPVFPIIGFLFLIYVQIWSDKYE